MATGTVEWFDDKRGFGWLNEVGRAERVFVHYSAIDSTGFKTLSAGDAVIFDVEQSPKGPRAENVIRLST